MHRIEQDVWGTWRRGWAARQAEPWFVALCRVMGLESHCYCSIYLHSLYVLWPPLQLWINLMDPYLWEIFASFMVYAHDLSINSWHCGPFSFSLALYFDSVTYDYGYSFLPLLTIYIPTFECRQLNLLLRFPFFCKALVLNEFFHYMEFLEKMGHHLRTTNLNWDFSSMQYLILYLFPFILLFLCFRSANHFDDPGRRVSTSWWWDPSDVAL